MIVTARRRIAFAMLDELLARWRAKEFPYDQREALVPQSIIPETLRRDRRALACFYFYACIYMRGGIESMQAFRALLRMHAERPEVFDPFAAQWLSPETATAVLRAYIGWDARRAGINWVENSRRLVEDWKGDPLTLIKNLRDYPEALRRLRNKRTKRDARHAGARGRGFFGFQPKMVSMFLYFCDWEGWLTKRFPYPSPADFHNFRLALNQGALIIQPTPYAVRVSEKLSKPWRDTVLAYLRARKADPVDVADALWLFSLVLCGNSPLTKTTAENGSGLFGAEALPHELPRGKYHPPRMRAALEKTCLACPLQKRCSFAIPSQPYYRKGQLILRPRPRVERAYGGIALATGVPERSRGEFVQKSLILPSARR